PRRGIGDELLQPPAPPGVSPAQREAEEALRAITAAELTRIAWTITTFAIIGLALAAGTCALCRTTAARLPPFAVVCIGLGAGIPGLAIARYSRPVQEGSTWIDWITSTTQSKYAWAGHSTVACLIAVTCELVALRPTADPRRWLLAAMFAMFIGTLLTLGGIS